MKIEKVSGIIVPPPATYRLTLTIEELYALRGLLGANPRETADNAYHAFEYSRIYLNTDGPREKEALESIADKLWTETNKHLDDIREYLKK